MSLDLRTGRPVWEINRLPIPRHRKLAKNIRSEVVVVGGGISGALIAHKLTQLGMQVTIVDSRVIGAGSTMASTAILSYEADVNLADLIGKIGESPAVRAYKTGIEAIDSIAETIDTLDDRCDFKRRKSLYLASSLKDAKMMRREYECRQKHGFNVEFLERSRLRKLFSLSAPCAILNLDAAEVNPRKLTLALVRGAQRRGLKVFCHTKVNTYRRQKKVSFLTTEDGFQIRARHVVFATGYESQQFLKQKAVQLVSSYAITSQAGTNFRKVTNAR